MAIRGVMVLAVSVAGGIGACGGPLDSPDPLPLKHDAGVDLRTGAGGHRAISGAGGFTASLGGFQAQPDAGAAGGSGGWPAVDGCVTGRAPQPDLALTTMAGPVVMGCVGISRTIAWLVDDFRQGMIYSADLVPPQAGLSVAPMGMALLCGDGSAAPIDVVLGMGVKPGDRFDPFLRISIQGPVAPIVSGQLSVVVQATDFTLNRDVLDFGVVALGSSQSFAVSATNGAASAPLRSLYATPSTTGPFSLLPAVSRVDPTFGLGPGATDVFLIATVNGQAAGSFQNVFIVSPFPPGAAINPLCGAARRLVVRAQISPTP